MATTINKRFEELITALYKGNKRAFATAIGVSPTVIENVVGARQGKPSYDVIEKLCANANVSPGWLILGEGTMLRDEQPAAMSEQVSIQERDPRDIQLIATQDDLIASLKHRIRDLEHRHTLYSQDVGGALCSGPPVAGKPKKYRE